MQFRPEGPAYTSPGQVKKNIGRRQYILLTAPWVNGGNTGAACILKASLEKR